MKKAPLLFLLFCLAFGNLQAQENTQLAKTWTLGLNLIGADIIGEFPVSDKSTFRVLAGGVLSGVLIEADPDEFDFIAVGTLHASATYRHYYRIKDINRKGKPLLFNSGNYVFGQLRGSQNFYNEIADTEEINDDFYASIGVGWGIQRMYQNKFVFSLGFGPGYEIFENDFTVISELTLGIRLNQRN